MYAEELLREADSKNFSKYNCMPNDSDPNSTELFDPEFERPE